jgi:hypothetical protein
VVLGLGVGDDVQPAHAGSSPELGRSGFLQREEPCRTA